MLPIAHVLVAALASGGGTGAYDLASAASLSLDARALWEQPGADAQDGVRGPATTDDLQDVPPNAQEPPPQNALTEGNAGGFWRHRGGFLEEDSTFLTFGAGAAYSGGDSTDYAGFVAWEKFIVDDVQTIIELTGWYFDQEDDNEAAGASFVLDIRWHFWSSQPQPGLDPAWTVYADVGIGLMYASDDVPDRGTRFNTMPRFGVGLTRRLTDSGVRLQAGVRWHHISNARIFGQDDNPSRDGAFAYAGITFPF